MSMGVPHAIQNGGEGLREDAYRGIE